MFGLFNRNKKAAEAAVQQEPTTAPGTTIRYSPDLVESLEADHKKLLGLYGKIQKAFDAKQFEEVSSMLKSFKSGLNAHLLTENVRLYIYLDHSLSEDPLNSELIHGFRREMDDIAKVALGFLTKYETIGVDEHLAPYFMKDFATIGEVLVERIEREESTLYPLYMPSYT